MADALADVDRLAFSPTELADKIGCSRQHVHNMIRRGEIRSVKLGRRRLIPAEALAELLNGADDEFLNGKVTDGAA